MFKTIFEWFKRSGNVRTETIADNSLVDARHVSVELECRIGFETRVPNPLDTDFDLVDLFERSSGIQLQGTRHLHSWSQNDEQDHGTSLGVWVSATRQELVFNVGFGSSAWFHNNVATSEFDISTFLSLPDHLIDQSSVEFDLTVWCMN
ncbi:hypothetical protein [Pseudosulfitobacter sp. SM2401]|uniref:hypothetical protein n=1 Tax=Pseudosulfitobacter sp. SM2401 TaxID=3350098 RepID=UPI0036F30BF0